MKQKMKHLVSFIAVLVMLVSMFSVCVFPAAAADPHQKRDPHSPGKSGPDSILRSSCLPPVYKYPYSTRYSRSRQPAKGLFPKGKLFEIIRNILIQFDIFV